MAQQHAKLDPFRLRIQQEVEEFLKDLTTDHPFPEVFEVLKRREFRDRFGHNVTPLPPHRYSSEDLRAIGQKVNGFLTEIHKTYGTRYRGFIDHSFRYYTETTLDD